MMDCPRRGRFLYLDLGATELTFCSASLQPRDAVMAAVVILFV